jgi:hypothetical protein
MATWELEHNSTRQTFAAWGITSHALSRVSLAPDVLELTVETADALTVDPWGYGDTIEVFKDSVRYFLGTVATLPKRGTADAHTITYRIEGPWSYLERTTFQQDWGQINSAEDAIEQVARARVLMGMDDDGNVISTGAQIQAILEYVRDAVGAPYVIGSSPTGVNAWTSDSTGETAADLIRRLMAWNPKEVSYFDYTTTIPTLYIGPPPTLLGVTIDTATNKNVTSLSYTNREDLIPDSVVFFYERDHDFNGSITTKTERQAYPTIGPYSGPGVVTSTISLRGAKRTTQEARIHAETLPSGSSSAGGANQDLEEFWKRKLPWLAKEDPPGSPTFPQARWIVLDHTITVDEQGTRPPSLISGDPVTIDTDVTQYPRELINGTVEEWMNVKTADLLVTATIAIDPTDPTDEEKRVFTQQKRIGGRTYLIYQADIRITGTDATSKIYRNVIEASAAEATPSGLAQDYYNNLQGPHYEGNVSLMEPEDSVTSGLQVGAPLTIDIDGTTVVPNGLIQEVVEQHRDGAISQSVRFGPPQHLSPQDFLEKLRIARALPKSTITAGERTQGEAASEATSTAPHDVPKSNSTVKPDTPVDVETGFNVTQLGDETIQVGPGWINENGQNERILQASPDTRKIVGTEELWAIALTDVYGGITGTSVVWGTIPVDVQVHREPETNDAEDPGQTGKYAWHVLTAVNDAGIVTVTPHRSGIEYYSDRSAKNWPEEEEISTEIVPPLIPGVPGGGGSGSGSPSDGASVGGNKEESWPIDSPEGVRKWNRTFDIDGAPTKVDLIPSKEYPSGVKPEDNSRGVFMTVPHPWAADDADPSWAAPNGFWHRNNTSGQWWERVDGAWVQRDGPPPSFNYFTGAPPAIVEYEGEPPTDTNFAVGDKAYNKITKAWKEFAGPEVESGELIAEGWQPSTAPDWIGEGAPVDSVAGKTGAVTLDADDVSDVVGKRWMTDAERTKLSGIIDTGTGSTWRDDSGSYSAPDCPVDSVAGKTGAVTLDANDVAEATLKIWFTPIERSQLALAYGSYHSHSNFSALGNIDDSGSGSSWLDDSGNYTEPNYPVDTVAGRTGDVVLTAVDVSESTDRNWLTDAERTAIAANTSDRHGHANKALLDSLVSSGTGSTWLDDSGAYSALPPALVDSVNGQTGTVVLDADDIAETTDKNWLTDAEETAIAANTADRHGHANKALLDGIINTGSGSSWLDDSGAYTAPDPAPVDSVAGQTGVVTLDADDVTETGTKLWFTPTEKSQLALAYGSYHSHSNFSALGNIDDSGSGSTWLDDSGNYTEPNYPVDSVAGQTGAVTLDADDVAETTTKKWFTNAERLTLARVDTQSHSHANKAVLDGIISSGTGSLWLDDSGNYTELSAPVDSVAGKTGVVTLDGNDITEVTNKRWLTDAERTKLTGIIDTGTGSTWLDDSGGYSSPDAAPVDSVAGKTGVVTLDADDVSESAARKWLTTAERAKIGILDDTGGGTNYLDDTGGYSPVSANSILESGTKVFVTPAQKLLIDVLDDTGGGGQFLGDDGNYAPLTADDVAETASKLWFTPTERSQLTTAYNNGHSHTNKTLLDSLISSGTGSSWLDDAGNYTEPNYPVDSVAGQTGNVTLDFDDITETTLKKYYSAAEKALVGNLTTGGTGGKYLDDTGAYVGVSADDITTTTSKRFITDSQLMEVNNLVSSGSGSVYKKDDGSYGTVSADHVDMTASRKFVTQSQLDDIGDIPLWWPSTAPSDGTYVSFTVTGGSVTFNT